MITLADYETTIKRRPPQTREQKLENIRQSSAATETGAVKRVPSSTAQRYENIAAAAEHREPQQVDKSVTETKQAASYVKEPVRPQETQQARQIREFQEKLQSTQQSGVKSREQMVYAEQQYLIESGAARREYEKLPVEKQTVLKTLAAEFKQDVTVPTQYGGTTTTWRDISEEKAVEKFAYIMAEKRVLGSKLRDVPKPSEDIIGFAAASAVTTGEMAKETAASVPHEFSYGFIPKFYTTEDPTAKLGLETPAFQVAKSGAYVLSGAAAGRAATKPVTQADVLARTSKYDPIRVDVKTGEFTGQVQYLVKRPKMWIEQKLGREPKIRQIDENIKGADFDVTPAQRIGSARVRELELQMKGDKPVGYTAKDYTRPYDVNVARQWKEGMTTFEDVAIRTVNIDEASGAARPVTVAAKQSVKEGYPVTDTAAGKVTQKFDIESVATGDLKAAAKLQVEAVRKIDKPKAVEPVDLSKQLPREVDLGGQQTWTMKDLAEAGVFKETPKVEPYSMPVPDFIQPRPVTQSVAKPVDTASIGNVIQSRAAQLAKETQQFYDKRYNVYGGTAGGVVFAAPQVLTTTPKLLSEEPTEVIEQPSLTESEPSPELDQIVLPDVTTDITETSTPIDVTAPPEVSIMPVEETTLKPPETVTIQESEQQLTPPTYPATVTEPTNVTTPPTVITPNIPAVWRPKRKLETWPLKQPRSQPFVYRGKAGRAVRPQATVDIFSRAAGRARYGKAELPKREEYQPLYLTGTKQIGRKGVLGGGLLTAMNRGGKNIAKGKPLNVGGMFKKRGGLLSSMNKGGKKMALKKDLRLRLLE